MFTKKSITGLTQKEWLELRKTGIGGSDAGAVCGLNPYASPMAVFQDKTSGAVEDQDNEAMRQGRDLEEYVARRFTEATGLKVHRSNCMYRSVEHPWMIADVDRLVTGEDAGLECKTASAYSADKWKDGEDMYILPSSVHELLLVPADGRVPLLELQKLVKRVNRESVDTSDRLSDRVYLLRARDAGVTIAAGR